MAAQGYSNSVEFAFLAAIRLNVYRVMYNDTP